MTTYGEGTAAPPPAPAGDQDRLAEPMRSRWSPSVFDPAHVLDADALETLLLAAAWAPSAGNVQPWRLLVALRGDALHRALVATLSRGNSGWVPRASACLVMTAQTARAPDEDRDPPATALYDAGQAAAHLTLQARAGGLDAHQFAGFDHDAFGRGADVPAWWTVVAGIAVGRHLPAGERDGVDPRDQERELRPRSRRPLSQAAYAGRWGRPWRP